MGKAMSLIPITIFTTLVASLFVSLTGTPAIFFLTSKDKNIYKIDKENEKYLLRDQKILLESDRE
jgi:multidrug efflux pump subunit AcrB